MIHKKLSSFVLRVHKTTRIKSIKKNISNDVYFTLFGKIQTKI